MFFARESRLTQLGFRFGRNGPHAARTMMLGDLQILFSGVPADAGKAAYSEEVVANNLLGKPTKKVRELAFRHLGTLYGLQPSLAVFRVFRRFWTLDEAARPVLALLVALARDPLLRSTQEFVRAKHMGDAVLRDDLVALLAANHRDRFSPASLISFAQNVNGTWTQAGFLAGHSHKARATPVVTPIAVAFALFLGHLEGLSGQRLFASSWTKLLGAPKDVLEAQTSAASHRGLLVFMHTGGVKEVRFPGYLSAQEEKIRQEASGVV